MTRLGLALLGFIVSTAEAQSIYDYFGTETFHRAYFVGPNVRFDPFQELNWKAKARTALPWLNLEQPTKAQIARLETFESAGPDYRSTEFRAPVDPLVRRASYLLLYDEGVVAMQPVELSGTVQIFFNEAMTQVQSEAISGTIISRPSKPVQSAAFAIVGRPSDVTDVQAGVRLTSRKQGDSLIYEFVDQGRTVGWTTAGREQPVPKTGVSFQWSGRRYLLVRWESDFCNSEYVLLQVGDVLTPIAGNGYDCDV